MTPPMSGKGRFVSAMHWLIVLMLATGGGSLIASCTIKAPAKAEPEPRYVVHNCFMRVLGARDADGDIPVSLLCDKPVPFADPEEAR